MSALLYILRGFWALIVDDYLLTFVILFWLGLVAGLRPLFHDGLWGAMALFIGLLAILLFSLIPSCHSPVSSEATHPTKPK